MIAHIAALGSVCLLVFALARVLWRQVLTGSEKVEQDAGLFELGQAVEEEEVADRSLDEHHDFCWRRMPLSMRQKAVDHLIDKIVNLDDLVVEYAKHGDLPPTFHMFGGMGVRNLLRRVIPDEELPAIKWGDGRYYRNWDDFYMRALEVAAGIRDIHGEVQPEWKEFLEHPTPRTDPWT